MFSVKFLCPGNIGIRDWIVGQEYGLVWDQVLQLPRLPCLAMRFLADIRGGLPPELVNEVIDELQFLFGEGAGVGVSKRHDASLRAGEIDPLDDLGRAVLNEGSTNGHKTAQVQDLDGASDIQRP